MPAELGYKGPGKPARMPDQVDGARRLHWPGALGRMTTFYTREEGQREKGKPGAKAMETPSGGMASTRSLDCLRTTFSFPLGENGPRRALPRCWS